MLVHRIPFPPNKGDKIRSFHLLQHLSQHYRVFLGCFIDDAFDEQYVSELQNWCEAVCCIRLHKTAAMLRGLTGFITGKAITLPYFFHPKMQRWTNNIIQQQQIQQVLIYSSAMAQYVQNSTFLTNKVIDFVDIDSDKWLQYSERSQGIKRWFYRRESALLQRYEIAICHKFNTSLFVSEDEAAAFRKLLKPKARCNVYSVNNGVDLDYFNPSAAFAKAEVPLPQDFIVFTGAMDYWANVDAVCWFSKEVWPTLQQQYPNLSFVIVGGNPHQDVKALASYPGIIVTGRVKDVRHYISSAAFVVAPMLIARGIQNKILEAMAMNKTVVCTTMAMEGINAPTSEHALIADGSTAFIDACLQSLAKQEVHNTNRQWVTEHFSWQHTLNCLNNFLQAKDA